MNFLNFHYFLVAAEELNITRAAERLYISQQSLSSHIIKLEKEYGVELFDRSTPHLTLTYAGTRLARLAVQILDLNKQISNEMNDINNNTKGKLTIGISHTRGRFILPDILPFYKTNYPGIELSLVEGNSNELEQKILHGQIDLIIGFSPIKLEEAETIEILSEKLFIIVPDIILKKQFSKDYEGLLEQLKSGTNVTILEKCPFLMLSKENRLRTIADEYLKKNGIKPNIILVAENIETLFALCIEGMGITFYPELFVKKINPLITSESAEKVHIIPLNDRSTDGKLVIGYHKGRYLSDASKKFISLVKEKLVI